MTAVKYHGGRNYKYNTPATNQRPTQFYSYLLPSPHSSLRASRRAYSSPRGILPFVYSRSRAPNVRPHAPLKPCGHQVAQYIHIAVTASPIASQYLAKCIPHPRQMHPSSRLLGGTPRRGAFCPFAPCPAARYSAGIPPGLRRTTQQPTLI